VQWSFGGCLAGLRGGKKVERLEACRLPAFDDGPRVRGCRFFFLGGELSLISKAALSVGWVTKVTKLHMLVFDYYFEFDVSLRLLEELVSCRFCILGRLDLDNFINVTMDLVVYHINEVHSRETDCLSV